MPVSDDEASGGGGGGDDGGSNTGLIIVLAVLGVLVVFGGAFALSSVLVPFCMGAIAGGIVSGQVPAGGRAGDPAQSWLNPTSLVTGVLGIVLAAYLASVYLVWEARRADDAELVEYFRRRAVVSAVAAGAVGAEERSGPNATSRMIAAQPSGWAVSQYPAPP